MATTDVHIIASGTVVVQQLVLPFELNNHADDVDLRIERKRFHVLVHNSHTPVCRPERRQGCKNQRRIDGAFFRQDPFKGAAKSPETVLKTRVD